MDKEGTRAVPSVEELQRIQGMGDLAVTLNTLFKDCVKVLETSGSDVISPESIVLEDAVTTGVTFSGAMTTGASFTGAMTTGISFTNAVTNGISFASGFTGVPISITAGTTYAINIAITTAAVGAFTGIQTIITGGVAHTGNVAGSRSYVTSDNTGRTYANLFGLVARATVLHGDDQVSGTMTGLLCQIDLGAAANSNACNAWGLCVNHIETGTRAKIPVAFIRFTDADYAGSAPTNYLFDCGATGNEFPTGTGKIYYNNTLWCRVNGTDQYLYMSKAEGYLSITDSATTAIAIATGTFTTGISIAGTTATGLSIAACTANGINFTGVAHVGINFTSATPTYEAYTSAGTGGRNNPFIKIGSWDDAMSITQTSDHFVPIQVNITKSGDIAFDTAAARLKVVMGTAHQPTSAIGCLQLRQTIAYNMASSCILNADVTVSGATTVQTGSLLGGYFSIQGAGAITKAGDNDCSVLCVVNNHTGGGIDNVLVALQNGTTANVDEIVKIAVTNGTAGTGIRFEGLTDQIIVAGSSSAPLTCDDASAKFLQFYFDCGATSGTSVGLYLREYLTGTGGSNACARIYSDVSVVASTAQGMQCSLGFGESTTTGSVTGLGVAGRFQIGLANAAYPGTGTLAVVQSEIYSFGDDSDPSGNAIAMFGVVNDGNANGMADVDDDAVLLHFRGWTSATGNMVVKAASPGAMGNATYSVRCKMHDGTLAYLNFTAAPVTA